jgi:hypothetical protein
MTEERLVLADLLEKAGDGDFLRAVAEAVLQGPQDDWLQSCKASTATEGVPLLHRAEQCVIKRSNGIASARRCSKDRVLEHYHREHHDNFDSLTH